MSANERGASPTIAVLALQGAFAEHEAMLAKLGVRWMELREAGDLHKEFDALILPGGESTVQAKLLKDLGMLAPLRARIEGGMPVLGTCAGPFCSRSESTKARGRDRASAALLEVLPLCRSRCCETLTAGSWVVFAPKGRSHAIETPRKAGAFR